MDLGFMSRGDFGDYVGHRARVSLPISLACEIGRRALEVRVRRRDPSAGLVDRLLPGVYWRNPPPTLVNGVLGAMDRPDPVWSVLWMR